MRFAITMIIAFAFSSPSFAIDVGGCILPFERLGGVIMP